MTQGRSVAVGRTFVITGGGTGLGRAFARTLASDGETVVLLGRRLDKVQAVADELGNGSWALACDISDHISVDMAFAEIAKRHPKIDGLINNAAYFTPFLIAEAPTDEAEAILDTNLKGLVWCCRAAIPLLDRGGIIVNVGSEGVMNPTAMFAVYQASKWGLERFTKALFAELAPQGIRVTMLRACKMYDEDFTWNVPPERMKQFAEENEKRGWRPGKQAIARFENAGAQIRWLVNLPGDVAVPEVVLDARFA
jgi:meso-butanediol dehydrogenase/(S,S)-butanediol dehydrogenase/diacetyl reductase